MIDRYLLRIVVVLFVALLPFQAFVQELYAQEWTEEAIQEYFEQQRIENGILLKGGTGDIPSLQLEYCSEGGYVDLVPPSWHPSAEDIQWTITTFVGSSEIHPTWGENIGTGQDIVFRFYPDRITVPYLGPAFISVIYNSTILAYQLVLPIMTILSFIRIQKSFLLVLM